MIELLVMAKNGITKSELMAWAGLKEKNADYHLRTKLAAGQLRREGNVFHTTHTGLKMLTELASKVAETPDYEIPDTYQLSVVGGWGPDFDKWLETDRDTAIEFITKHTELITKLTVFTAVAFGDTRQLMKLKDIVQ